MDTLVTGIGNILGIIIGKKTKGVLKEMKLKSLALLVALMLLAGISVPAFAASNPFADVPADHWAYDAIIQLAAVGLVEGYPDGTYGGSRMLTRYEAAMVFARTLARLESLVESEVMDSTAGVRDQITEEVLADIQGAKDSLVDLIKTELANLEIPVVEKTVVEQPIEITKVEAVEKQPIERPFEVTPEVEAVVRSLVADQVKDQLAGIEVAAEETIVETKIIERIVEAEDSLTTEDVEKIAEELLNYVLSDYEVLIDRALRENINQDRRVDELEAQILKRLRANEIAAEALEGDIAYVENRVLGLISGLRYDMDAFGEDLVAIEDAMEAEVNKVLGVIDDMGDEFEMELVLLGIRIDSLDFLVRHLGDRVDYVEEDLATLRTETERVQLSGSAKLEVKDVSAIPARILANGDFVAADAGTSFTQELDLNLAVKASDSVDVNLFLAGSAALDLADFELGSYGVEVLSESPVRRLVVGTLDDDEVEDRFSSLVLGTTPDFGLLADVEAFGLEANVVANDEVLGAGAEFAFVDELGFKAAYAVNFNDVTFEDHTKDGLVGIFGNLIGVNYDVVVALEDLDAQDNSFTDVNLDSELGPVELSLNWAKAQDNFTRHGFIDGDAETRFQLGAATELLGMDLSADLYQENNQASGKLFSANRFAYEQEFDLLLPFTVSGVLASADGENHREFKLAVSDLSVFGTDLTLGASYAVIKNRLDDNWKDVTDYTGVDVNILTADLGYELAFSNATLDLGYGLEYAMLADDAVNDELTQSIGAAYGFASDLTLSVDAERFTNLALDGQDNESVNTVKAGLEFKF